MHVIILNIVLSLSVVYAAPNRNAATHYEIALDRPDEAIKMLFPEGGGETFTAQSLSWRRNGPQKAEERQEVFSLMSFHLRDRLDPLYENEESPIVVYRTALGPVVLGEYTRWKKGTLEVFTVLTDAGAIKDVYVQRVDGLDKAHFRTTVYRSQFKGFGLSQPLDDAALTPPTAPESAFPSVDLLLAHQRVVRAVRWAVLTQKALLKGQWQDLRRVAAF